MQTNLQGNLSAGRKTSEDDGGKLPRLEFPLYLRPSWTRENAFQDPEPSGVNIGLVVEGTQ